LTSEPETDVPSTITLLELAFLWGAVALVGAQVYIAVRARRVEREHGLHRSSRRLTATAVVFAVVALLAGYATLGAAGAGSKSGTAKSAPAPGADVPGAPVPPTAAELAELERQKKELEEKLASVRTRIEAARGADAPRAKGDGDPTAAKQQESAPFEIPTFVLVGVVACAFVGLLLLLFLGDPEVIRLLLFGTLKDQGELRLRALGNLDALTVAADTGEFREGLTRADATDDHLLDKFERMDWLFLRSYCAVQLGMSAATAEVEQKLLLKEAIRGLTALLEEAPNHGEAAYLLATAHGFLREPVPALERFAQAEAHIPNTALPLGHNKSVCLLQLAEEKLATGDTDESGKLFDRVSELGVLADRIPTTLIRVRLIGVRRNLQNNQIAEAEAGIATVRGLEGLDPEQKRNVEAVCDALQTLASVRRGDDAIVLRQIDAFLTKHLPAGLPAPSEEIADEYLEAPAAGFELRLAPQVFAAFLFLKAAGLTRAALRHGAPPDATQVSEIARPLFVALQFELRQRDVLAALGGVYYWFVPEKRRKAVKWLEAAVTMGVESRVAHRLLDRDRRIAAENQEALEWFRSATGRFLQDPTVTAHVRHALIEELGRFQGFQPLLLELDRQIDLEPQEPTLRLIRERAGYVQQMVAEFATRKPAAAQAEFEQLRQEYARLIAALDASSGRMAELERRLVQEIGRTVLA
jgi:hypothetical protein